MNKTDFVKTKTLSNYPAHKSYSQPTHKSFSQFIWIFCDDIIIVLRETKIVIYSQDIPTSSLSNTEYG